MAHSSRTSRKHVESIQAADACVPLSSTERRPGQSRAALLATAALILLAPLFAQAAVIHVDDSAAGADNGSSWGDAYTDLQDALSVAASGDEIWVAAGVYKPTTDPAARTATFALKSGVAIYGGFAGMETARAQRNPRSNITVLSGDIDGNDTTDSNGVAVSAADIVGANAFHVTVGSGTTRTAILDGFTVTAGLANGSVDYAWTGGGLFILSGSPTLANLRFRGNWGRDGGGMGTRLAGPLLTNIEFSGNEADTGGGMYSELGSQTLINVSFRGNFAIRDGGGLTNFGSTALTNVSFGGNRAAGEGGGIINWDSLAIRNAVFWNNRDARGTGVISASTANYGALSISHSLVQGCNPGGIWSDASVDGIIPTCGTNAGSNLADADPLFVGTPNPSIAPSPTGNLRLLARSPAVDAGNAALIGDVENTTDPDGNPRLFGGSIDLGPYETPYLTIDLSTAGTGTGVTTIILPLPWRFDAGDSVAVAAVPDQSSLFAGWTGDSTAGDNPLTFNIQADTALTANFGPKIIVDANTGSGQGSITPASQGVLSGGSVTFTVVPDPFWTIDSVTGDTCNPLPTAGNEWAVDNITGPCSVEATFALPQYTVGGTVVDLQGDQVVLQNNSGDDQVITANGGFTFSPQDNGTAYNVAIAAQPANPNQLCSVINGFGTVNGGDVTTVVVNCVEVFSVGGTVSGLKLPGLVLDLNNTSLLLFDQDGAYSFSTGLPDGADYDVTTALVPDDHDCSVANAAGSIAGADAADVDVDCTTNIEFADDFETLSVTPIELD